VSHVFRGVAQLGSARRSGRRGRRFKSSHPDHEKPPNSGGFFVKNTWTSFICIGVQ
jgi:hypothetical protein